MPDAWPNNNKSPKTDLSPSAVRKTVDPSLNPILNPPTPFANTPSASRLDDTHFSKPVQDDDSEVDNKSHKSKLPKPFFSSKKPMFHGLSDSSDESDNEPMSAVTPLTTPTLPSLIQVSMLQTSIKQHYVKS